MYKLKQFVFILLTFFVTYLKADQLALIDKANAIKAVQFLRLNSDVVLFCGCCDGDIKKKIHVYQAIYKQDPKYKEYYEVSIKYEYQGDSIAGWEPLDLAYVHTQINGLWTPLGKVIGMECDPCVEPFVFASNANTKNELRTAAIAQVPNNVTCTEQKFQNEEGGGPLMALINTNLTKKAIGFKKSNLLQRLYIYMSVNMNTTNSKSQFLDYQLGKARFNSNRRSMR